jgi:hypothetical protein
VTSSSVQSVIYRGISIGVKSWIEVSPGEFDVAIDIPANIDLKWGTSGQLSVTDDTGEIVFSTPVVLSIPPGWETVVFSGTIPNPEKTKSFYQAAQTDAEIGNYTMLAGDVLCLQSAAGLTVDELTVPDISPYATVSGLFKIWREAQSSFTSTSTYEWVDDGGTITISAITDPIESGGQATLTGTGFGSTQGTSQVVQNGVAVSVVAWSDTSITVTTLDVETTPNKYGEHSFGVSIQ